MIKLTPSEKNAIDAIEYLVRSQKIKVTSKTIIERLYLHPDFPSLAALSDTLTEWKIRNLVTRITVKQLTEVPLPALTFLEIEDGYIAPVRKATMEHGVEWRDIKRGWQTNMFSSFTQKWNGVALLIEPDEGSGEARYPQKRKMEILETVRFYFLIAALIAIGPLWIISHSYTFQHISWTSYELLMAKLIGAGITGLMLLNNIDSDNPFLRAICGTDSKTNCSNILNSGASRLWGWLSWSEIGFIYFSGGVIVLFFSVGMDQTSLMPLLIALNILTLPYTIFSIYYQAFVAKQWCVLCIAVQVLLWTEFGLTILVLPNLKFDLDTTTAAQFILAFMLPAVCWTLIKKPLRQSARIFPLLREFNKVKFNEEYVGHFFRQQPTAPPKFGGIFMPAIGRPDAIHTLTIVTNPLCGPCTSLHFELRELLRESEMFRCEYVFHGPPRALMVASIILKLPNEFLAEALNTWYIDNSQSVNQWAANLPHQQEDSDQLQLDLHRRWCQLANIQTTPTLFVNGIRLPTYYTVEDLKIIASMLSQSNVNITYM